MKNKKQTYPIIIPVYNRKRFSIREKQGKGQQDKKNFIKKAKTIILTLPLRQILQVNLFV